ncbi:hypothetical protein OJ996_07475 [Luteolibacter sp. GHJ8]|uniref:Choice-of-anchor D domain-containing protein n=1 Tax=Luteolibacter rhizosphaerae TaxID=2989719 RepID=A0ABT3G0Q4_9BACT|nr:hypothetical protein [Luteolibacter rhizosphaerae]MCW1913407.1 hypothetical protein [Luteolibacter rhizosphaerae]
MNRINRYLLAAGLLLAAIALLPLHFSSQSAGTPSGQISSSLAASSPAPVAPHLSSYSESLNAHPDLAKVVTASFHQIRPISGEESLLPKNEGSLYFANNPGQSYSARFQQDGVLIRNADGARDLKIASRSTQTASITVQGSRISYKRADGSGEWFENGPRGLEHGMTLAARPADAGVQLEIPFTIEGMSSARDASGNIAFKDKDGTTAYAYKDIKAWDSRGEILDASLAAIDGGVAWIVNDREAVYPITIDPLIVNTQTLPLPSPGNGYGTAVDLNGNLAAVSALGEPSAPAQNSGAVYVYRKTGTTWAQEARLTSSTPNDNEGFGAAVAIEGDVLAVVTQFDNSPSNTSSIQIFRTFGSSWNHQETIQPNPLGYYFIGSPIDMDGGVLVVGVPGEVFGPSVVGALWVYQVNQGGVTGPTKIFSSGMVPQEGFGGSVAIKGNQIAAGASWATKDGVQNVGAVYVFSGFGAFWNQQAKLHSPEPTANEAMGTAVAIDTDKILAGAVNRKPGAYQHGAAYVFTRNGGSWGHETSIRVNPAIQRNIFLGESVAISGNLLALTAAISPLDETNRIVLYQRIGRTWFRRNNPETEYLGDTRYPKISLDGSAMVAGYSLAGVARAYSLGNANSAQEIAVYTGEDTALVETLNGAPLNFGDVPVSTNKSWPITIYNDGLTDLEVTAASLLPGASSDISVDPIQTFPFGSLIIAPGATAKITVRTNFSTTGNKTATLRLESNDADEPNFDIPLSFRSYEPPAPGGLTITRENGIPVLRYPHLQFFNYQVEVSTDLNQWNHAGFMQMEFDPNSGAQVRIFRDFNAPFGKSFYRVKVN